MATYTFDAHVFPIFRELVRENRINPFVNLTVVSDERSGGWDIQMELAGVTARDRISVTWLEGVAHRGPALAHILRRLWAELAAEMARSYISVVRDLRTLKEEELEGLRTHVLGGAAIPAGYQLRLLASVDSLQEEKKALERELEQLRVLHAHARGAEFLELERQEEIRRYATNKSVVYPDLLLDAIERESRATSGRSASISLREADEDDPPQEVSREKLNMHVVPGFYPTVQVSLPHVDEPDEDE